MSNAAASGLSDLSGRTALITGATGGIGRGIAERLARAGAHVIVHSGSSFDRAALLADALTKDGFAASPAKANVTIPREIDQLLSALESEGRAPELLVNSAALQPVNRLALMDVEEWRAVHAVNLEGVFSLTRSFCAGLIKNKKPGAIVNIASIEGADPAMGHGHYASSKAGLIMLTKSIALEYGEYGIRANAVSPGLINREDLEADWPEGVASWRKNAPLTRLGEPADVANAVLFLLSDAAEWISGANLVVDGGMSSCNRW